MAARRINALDLNYLPQTKITQGQIDAGTQCPICLEDFTTLGGDVAILACKHVFHNHCLTEMLQYQNKCCVCRQAIDTSNWRRNPANPLGVMSSNNRSLISNPSLPNVGGSTRSAETLDSHNTHLAAIGSILHLLPPNSEAFFSAFSEFLNDIETNNTSQEAEDRHQFMLNFMRTSFPDTSVLDTEGSRDNDNSNSDLSREESLDDQTTQILDNYTANMPNRGMSEEDLQRLSQIQITQAQVDDQAQCAVCMEEFNLDENVRNLPCFHLFHSECITSWLRTCDTCPICRTAVNL